MFYIEKALKIAPNSSFLYREIARVYIDLGEYKKSLKNAKKSYDLNPNDIDNLEVLSVAYIENNEFEKSISTAFEAWKIKQDIMSGYLEGHVANAYRKLEKFSEALKYYKIAIAKGFDNKNTYVHFYIDAINTANCLSDFKSALSLCSEALIFLPDNEKIKELSGKSLKKSGEVGIYNFNPFRNI